jgi:hypothetical protein
MGFIHAYSALKRSLSDSGIWLVSFFDAFCQHLLLRKKSFIELYIERSLAWTECSLWPYGDYPALSCKANLKPRHSLASGFRFGTASSVVLPCDIACSPIQLKGI